MYILPRNAGTNSLQSSNKYLSVYPKSSVRPNLHRPVVLLAAPKAEKINVKARACTPNLDAKPRMLQHQRSESDLEFDVEEAYQLLDLSSSSQASEHERKRHREKLNHLTQEEKINRRKQKNRIAAQAARDRKKHTSFQLEQSLKTALDEICRLRQQLYELRKENQLLRREVSFGDDSKSPSPFSNHTDNHKHIDLVATGRYKQSCSQDKSLPGQQICNIPQDPSQNLSAKIVNVRGGDSTAFRFDAVESAEFINEPQPRDRASNSGGGLSTTIGNIKTSTVGKIDARMTTKNSDSKPLLEGSVHQKSSPESMKIGISKLALSNQMMKNAFFRQIDFPRSSLQHKQHLLWQQQTHQINDIKNMEQLPSPKHFSQSNNKRRNLSPLGALQLKCLLKILTALLVVSKKQQSLASLMVTLGRGLNGKSEGRNNQQQQPQKSTAYSLFLMNSLREFVMPTVTQSTRTSFATKSLRRELHSRLKRMSVKRLVQLSRTPSQTMITYMRNLFMNTIRKRKCRLSSIPLPLLMAKNDSMGSTGRHLSLTVTKTATLGSNRSDKCTTTTTNNNLDLSVDGPTMLPDILECPQIVQALPQFPSLISHNDKK